MSTLVPPDHRPRAAGTGHRAAPHSQRSRNKSSILYHVYVLSPTPSVSVHSVHNVMQANNNRRRYTYRMPAAEFTFGYSWSDESEKLGKGLAKFWLMALSHLSVREDNPVAGPGVPRSTVSSGRGPVPCSIAIQS